MTPVAFRTRRSAGRAAAASSSRSRAARSPGSAPARISSRARSSTVSRGFDGERVVVRAHELVDRGQIAQLHDEHDTYGIISATRRIRCFTVGMKRAVVVLGVLVFAAGAAVARGAAIPRRRQAGRARRRCRRRRQEPLADRDGARGLVARARHDPGGRPLLPRAARLACFARRRAPRPRARRGLVAVARHVRTGSTSRPWSPARASAGNVLDADRARRQGGGLGDSSRIEGTHACLRRPRASGLTLDRAALLRAARDSTTSVVDAPFARVQPDVRRSGRASAASTSYSAARARRCDRVPRSASRRPHRCSSPARCASAAHHRFGVDSTAN